MRAPLTFDEFKMLAKDSKRIAVFQEIPAGELTPFIIYSRLHQALKTEGMMLEDLHQRECTRYSFICFEPRASLAINNNDKRQPLSVLREFQKTLTYSTRADVADLITNGAGFITYDVVRYFEAIPDRHAVNPSLPLLLFNFYSLSVTFDHEKQTILMSIVVDVSDPLEKVYRQAQERLQSMIEHMFHTSDQEIHSTGENRPTSNIHVDTSDADFMRMVEKAKDYIIRGDAFQIVLSRCFKRDYSVSPLEIYKALRQVSPSPFMFYFPTKNNVMIGASPERFIRVHNKQVTVNPIAGTRKSTADTTHEQIKKDLLTNHKELAEHMMLVDLARNDVGAVSLPGSVQVNELLHVKHFSHVSHITSTISGQLQENYDAFDAFAAAFPAGTLSGAPKIRAMQIIDELETSRRGLYGGAMCRFDSLGNFDSCIAIRMAVLQDGIATVRAGGGIVYDSDPAAEAQENRQKAQSMLDAIAKAHGEDLCY